MIFRTDNGTGPPVVLLHGFCETHVIWKNIVASLDADFRVIAYDLPGFGNSPLPTDLLSVDYVAELLNQDLSALGITNYVVIGHSLGGYVALAMADIFPNQIKALGLFHSSSFSDSVEKRKTRDKVAAFIEENGVRSFTKNFVPGLFYNKGPDTREDMTTLVEIAGDQSIAALVGYTYAMKIRPDRRYILAQSKEMPILFIAGDKDMAVPIEVSLEHAKLLNPENTHILKDTGHMGMFERKNETRDIIRDFCSRAWELPID